MAHDGTILVAGADGMVGTILVPILLDRGVRVRALVQEESAGGAFRELGADVVVADMETSKNLDRALDGVDKVYLVTDESELGGRYASSVIVAAKDARVSYIVRQGIHGPDTSRIVENDKQAEAKIGAKDLPHTIILPTWLMQHTLMSADTVASDGEIRLPFGDGKVGMVDARDVAEVAAEVLTAGGHEGETYILTGPESVSYRDVAAALSGALDREVDYVSVPPDEAMASMKERGMSEWKAHGYRELMEGFAANWGDEIWPDVERVLGRPARSIEQFAEDYADEFRRGVRPSYSSSAAR